MTITAPAPTTATVTGPPAASARVLRFDQMPSTCPTPEVATAARIDPFYAGLWAAGSQASWLSVDQAHAQQREGLGRLPAHLNLDRATALRRLTDAATLPKRLNAMATLDMWRTVTGEQAAALTGDTELAGKARAWTELFAAGVADTGIFSNGLYNTQGSSRGALYRPSRTTVFQQKVRPHLTYPEAVSVTGGYPWESGSQFDRHNLLAVELGLRAAEWCPGVGAVLGEKLSGFELLTHTGRADHTLGSTQAQADATIVRKDGLRIAVEMTASTGASFEAKVERWAKLLSHHRLADTGIVVVFVVAPRPDKTVAVKEVAVAVRKAVAKATRAYPGVNFDRTADRMFVAEWTSWFPAARQVDRAFMSLAAYRPSGPADQLWRPALLLEPAVVPFTASDTTAAAAVLRNASMLRGVPHWLRTSDTPILWPQKVSELGYPGLPVPAASRPETYKGKPLGAGHGVSGATRPPKRLRTTL
ncbi:hypothetical protein [Curtobacterium sp. MCBD17_040]|uniref:hypothetical protein n=1 Tax=Curtobacterium sp. MCBD17_040 TaxID=2175674 RepID=UPI000DA79016|nr:hypothetical protein [Curtobacterium sp. MCBD17_040]WIB65736.1 hypothetical protein DEI94_16590 [Curtobacterium sp. MCBD17_040]